MNSDALATAIQAYFAGERHEGFAILAFSAGLVLVAAAIHMAARDGFSCDEHHPRRCPIHRARAMRYAGHVRAALAERRAP